MPLPVAARIGGFEAEAMGLIERVVARITAHLRNCVVSPAPRDRVWAATTALSIIAFHFHHGTQPYAVDAVSTSWDKAANMLLFFVLAALVSVAFAGRRLWAVLAMCAMVAGTDELAQMLDPGREVDLADWIADVGAVLLAGLLLARWRRHASAGARSLL